MGKKMQVNGLVRQKTTSGEETKEEIDRKEEPRIKLLKFQGWS